MSAAVVEIGARLRAEDLEHGTWIAVLRAHEIPHVVMLQEGVCFSLEHDGNRRYTARKFWRLVDTKRIPTLLCELGPWARGRVADTYAAHARIEGEGDCFLPVRDYCAAWFADCGASAFPTSCCPCFPPPASSRAPERCTSPWRPASRAWSSRATRAPTSARASPRSAALSGPRTEARAGRAYSAVSACTGPAARPRPCPGQAA